MPVALRKPSTNVASRSNASPTKSGGTRARRAPVSSSVSHHSESRDVRRRPMHAPSHLNKPDRPSKSPQKRVDSHRHKEHSHEVQVNQVLEEEINNDGPLQFRIVYVSSEAQQNPVTNIEQKDREGWCTKPFAEPPHELIFQFQGLTRIKKIKMLSHSFKIAKKIEIYIGNLPNSIKELNEKTGDKTQLELISFHRASFKRIGYTSFQDNSKTEWKAWELKTANVDVTCSFIKFKIRSCHDNQLNVYNQVSLIGVEFYGNIIEKFPDFILNSMIGISSRKGIGLSDMRPIARKENIDDDDYRELDRVTIEQIKKLIKYKEKARRAEDFKRAHFLKSQILGLKQTAHQLITLETQKNEAADNDDFLLAEELKQKILQLKEVKNTFANAALEEERREQLTVAREEYPESYSHSRVEREEESPIAPHKKGGGAISRQISVEESYSDNRNSYDSQVNRQSQVFENQADDEVPFHQPTRRQIESIHFNSSIDAMPYHNQVSRSFDADEYEELNEIQQTLRSSIDTSPSHRIHHEDSPVMYNPHSIRPDIANFDSVAHDDQPVRPSKNNRYDFETHADAFEPFESKQQIPGPNAPIQEEFVAELDAWEANMVAWIVQHIDTEPSKLLPGVDDLQLFISVFGEFVAKALHSSLRIHREKAVEAIIQYLDQIPIEKHQLLTAVCQYMKRGLKDKIPQVYFLSIELLQKTISFCSSEVKKSVYHHSILPVIPILVSLLGESNTRKKNDAEQTIITIADQKNIGPAVFVKYLLKEDKNDKNWRLLHGKLLLLAEFIRRYGFTESNELTEHTIMPVVQKSLNNSRREVRTAAVSVTVEVFLVLRETTHREDIVNWFAQKYLQVEMHEALRKEILECISADDPSEAAASAQPPAPKRRGTISGVQDMPQEADISNKAPHDTSIEEDEAQAIIVASEDGNLLCNLCDSVIEVGENEQPDDLIDQHIMFECPILQKCPLCGAVVEIFDMNQHQLHDCDQRDQIQQCDRCKMAILKEEYDEHVKSESCPVAGKETQICPLCSDEIDMKHGGWKKHLITDGCPANPKSFKG